MVAISQIFTLEELVTAQLKITAGDFAKQLEISLETVLAELEAIGFDAPHDSTLLGRDLQDELAARIHPWRKIVKHVMDPEPDDPSFRISKRRGSVVLSREWDPRRDRVVWTKTFHRYRSNSSTSDVVHLGDWEFLLLTSISLGRVKGCVPVLEQNLKDSEMFDDSSAFGRSSRTFVRTLDAGPTLDVWKHMRLRAAGTRAHPFVQQEAFLQLTERILWALYAFHRGGYVHCDLHAGNIAIPVKGVKLRNQGGNEYLQFLPYWDGVCVLDLDFAISRNITPILPPQHDFTNSLSYLSPHLRLRLKAVDNWIKAQTPVPSRADPEYWQKVSSQRDENPLKCFTTLDWREDLYQLGCLLRDIRDDWGADDKHGEKVINTGLIKEINLFIDNFPEQLQAWGGPEQIDWDPVRLVNHVHAPADYPHYGYMAEIHQMLVSLGKVPLPNIKLFRSDHDWQYEPTSAGTPIRKSLPRKTAKGRQAKAALVKQSDANDVSNGGQNSTPEQQGVPDKIGKYLILRCIHNGADVSRYEGVASDTFRRVVITTFPVGNLPKDTALAFSERLAEKVKPLKALEGRTDVLPLCDAGLDGNKAYVAMEYFEGKRLDEFLSANESYDLKEALHIVASLCRGLKFAHEAGFLHLGISPAEVIVDPKGEIRLAGFGLAPIMAMDEFRHSSERVSMNVGTSSWAAFSSPEQSNGLPPDERSDVYSLGILLYRLLTGTTPLLESDLSAPHNSRGANYIQPSDTNRKIPSYMNTVVAKAIAVNPDERYQTILRFHDSIVDPIIKRLGRYNVDQHLPYNGGLRYEICSIYCGYDTRVRRKVILKTLRSSKFYDPRESEVYATRFEREARVLARLDHPNIVKLLDVGMEDDISYLVTEYVQGTTLIDLMHSEASEKAPVDHKRVVHVIDQLCNALHHSHSAGIVNCDVSGSNLVIENSGILKIIGFFNAHISDADLQFPLDAHQGALFRGAFRYSAPELIAGEMQNISGRTDIFSAGVILYRLLTRNWPFTGDSLISLSMKVLYEDPPVPSTLNRAISPLFDAVVMKSLAKQPEARYQSALDLSSDLKEALKEGRGT